MVVIPVAPKINSLFSENDCSKSFKLLSIIYTLFHAAFGLDFGFFNPKSLKLEISLKIFSFIKSVVICLICARIIVTHQDFQMIFCEIVTIIHYLMYMILLLFFKRNGTFCSLLKDLQVIDLAMNVEKTSYNLEIKILSVIVISILHRGLLQIIFCVLSQSCIQNVWSNLLFLSLIVCIDFVHITYTFVFYSLYCRLDKLIAVLRKPSTDVISLQYVYKSLVDIAERHKTAFDIVFIASLIMYVPFTMVTIHYSVLKLMDKRPTTSEILAMSIYMDYAMVIATSVLTLFPPLAAGMLTAKANQLRIMLYDKLFYQQDEEQKILIERFIGFVETRACRFYVCQVIPLNADLLGMVLSFCVTYIIVIIQFTHY